MSADRIGRLLRGYNACSNTDPNPPARDQEAANVTQRGRLLLQMELQRLGAVRTTSRGQRWWRGAERR